jgi:hypothetical protein
MFCSVVHSGLDSADSVKQNSIGRPDYAALERTDPNGPMSIGICRRVQSYVSTGKEAAEEGEPAFFLHCKQLL